MLFLQEPLENKQINQELPRLDLGDFLRIKEKGKTDICVFVFCHAVPCIIRELCRQEYHKPTGADTKGPSRTQTLNLQNQNGQNALFFHKADPPDILNHQSHPSVMLSGHNEELWSGSELGTGGSGDYICQLTFHCYLCQNLDGDGQYSGFASCVTTVDSLPILHTSTSGSLVFFCVSSTFSGCAELRAVSPQLFVHFPFPCPRSLSSLPLSRFLGLKDLHPQFCPGCVS